MTTFTILAQAASHAGPKLESLNGVGGTIMFISIGTVLSLVSFCFFRVLTLPPKEVEETFHAPLDLDPGDSDT